MRLAEALRRLGPRARVPGRACLGAEILVFGRSGVQKTIHGGDEKQKHGGDDADPHRGPAEFRSFVQAHELPPDMDVFGR